MNTEKSTDGLYEGELEQEFQNYSDLEYEIQKVAAYGISILKDNSNWGSLLRAINNALIEAKTHPENKLPDQKGWPTEKDIIHEAIKLYPYAETPLDPADDQFVRNWNHNVNSKRDLFVEHFNYITQWLKTYLQPDTK